MVRSYLLTFVVRQHLSPTARFLEKHPGAWLVWEPGDWKVPKRAKTTLVSGKPTKPRTGDALCTYLEPTAEGGKPLKVGRDPANDLVLNDATVSRVQFVLEPAPENRWTIRAQPNSTPMTINEQPLAASQQLKSGDRLLLGQVVLTYLDAPAFAQRVAALKG
jgi:hypothetical protein